MVCMRNIRRLIGSESYNKSFLFLLKKQLEKSVCDPVIVKQYYIQCGYSLSNLFVNA